MFLKYFLKHIKILARYNSMIMNSKPIIVILGSTGTGKTKLSVELAKKFNGEIINADSMQVYKGLDIVTAKATVEERCGVKHHLFDFVDPLKYFSVVNFRDMAIEIINDLLNADKTPIIVGGTNYYIGALLWHVLIAELNTRTISDNFYDDIRWKNLEFIDRSIDNSSLHEMLRELDPETADQLHPNNRRRVLRAIQVIKQTGSKMSTLIHSQQNDIGGSSLGGPLRFSNTIIFWLNCDQSVLDERLNRRVDKMIENGLVNELIDFHIKFNKQRLANKETLDYTIGLFQTIGFKEFHEYLMQLKDEEIVINDAFFKSVIDMKIATRRYARKQIKYIKNHLLGHSDREVKLSASFDQSFFTQV